MCIAKAWTAIHRLSIIWEFDLFDKINQVAVMSVLLYRCTTWTLTKRIEKKLDGNDIRTEAYFLTFWFLRWVFKNYQGWSYVFLNDQRLNYRREVQSGSYRYFCWSREDDGSHCEMPSSPGTLRMLPARFDKTAAPKSTVLGLPTRCIR